MSPRKRDARKRSFPPNLYERNGYFAWRNPIDGKEHGLGRDKRKAFLQAVEANLHVEGLRTETRLVDKLTGNADRTFGKWMERYTIYVTARELADNTRRSYASLHKLALELLGADAQIDRITTLDIANALEAVQARGNQRQAQALRSRMREIFRKAMAEGWVAANPVAVTDHISVKVQRARLPWEAFMAVYTKTGNVWLRNAMALAITTGQRREDLAVAKFADVHDDAWWCVQIKTGNRVCLPTNLRLDAFGMSLGEIVKQCRTTGVISKHLVHQVSPRGNSTIGAPIWKDTITRRFTDELTEHWPSDWEGNNPPTFHEIRSLAERMYDAQGNVKTQDLLGHKDARSTALYHDRRGMEWVRVQVG
uniref:Integrase n=1 Tax=Mycena chlorophos TaxID=658473 RepID=A0ABQ0L0B8_MYCCL|nr:integrase [Mycena chlorophos]